MKSLHIVPLAPQAIEVLQALQTLANGRELLFPGERDHAKPMSNNTILAALDRMGFKGRMTGHGFRGVASTALHEHGFAHHVIEAQLAHQERNETAAAYNHALYLKDRRSMMCWWADHRTSCARARTSYRWRRGWRDGSSRARVGRTSVPSGNRAFMAFLPRARGAHDQGGNISHHRRVPPARVALPNCGNISLSDKATQPRARGAS
jgi:hypothetical protein